MFTMFFYNTIEDPDWTAVLYAALIMLSVPIIILGFFKVVHKIVSPSPIKQPWSSIFIQFIFGVALFLFGAIKITSHSSNTDTKSSDTKSSDAEPSNSAPTSTEPSNTVPIPETPDTSSDIIGYTLMLNRLAVHQPALNHPAPYQLPPQFPKHQIPLRILSVIL